MRKFGMLSLILLISSMGQALDSSKPVRQYVPRLLTVTDGLPQPWVQTIVQTPDGYMWFGTQEGISRFNGAQFRTLDKDNTEGINHNNIRVLLSDKVHGALWVGTYGGGLTSYKDGKFQAYTAADGLPGNFVLALAQGPDGKLWIGTDKGLAILQDGKITPFQEQPGKHPITHITLGPDSTVWFLSNGAVYRVDAGAQVLKTSLHFPEPQTIFADRQGSLWIGTAAHGLYKVYKERITHYGQQAGVPKAPIGTVYQDRAGSIWITAYNAGLCRLQPADQFDCYTAKDGLMETTLVTLYEDREGDLWLGTEANGVIRLRDSNFVTYDERRGLSSSYVLGLHESGDGTVWVGTRPGLNRIKDGKITVIPLAASMTGSTVSAIEDGENGALWVGTEQGLKLLRGGKVVRIFTTRDGLATNNIHALLRDRQGILWIGDRSGGLTRYQDGKFTRFTQKDGISSVRVRNIFEDHAGNIWFSTEEGLTRFQDGSFTNFVLEKGKNRATGGAVCIYEDSQDTLWIGTYGSGLVRFRGQKFTSFTRKDGLFDDSIWSIVEDDSANLWMSSNLGLFRILKSDLNGFAEGKISKLTSISYGTSDGLVTTDFNGGQQSTGWKTRDGRLLFATSKGLVEVDPRHLHANDLPPPVVIEESKANNIPIVPSKAVPVGRGDLEFHFAGLSFIAPRKVVFQYKLEGFDKNWIFAGSRHAAYYTNIPPGSYQFRVVAANNDGVWNIQGATVAIDLKPHFYQTLWFDLMCALGALLIAGAIYRLRIRQLRRRETQLLVLVDERTKELQLEIVERNWATQKAEAASRAKGEFLANMSHEIRTPLNGVIGTLELAAQTELTAEQQELLQICRISADGLLAILNDILDFSKIEAGKLQFEEREFLIAGAVADAVRTFAGPSQKKKIELRYSVELGVPARLSGDPNRLKQVLMNLLGNAVKFTEKGRVFVRVQPEEAGSDTVNLRFSVSDTGIGIPVEKQKSIFEAFSQADSSVTRRFGGTGLGLAICARIVNLLGGRIWVESTPGTGSTFSFTVPFKVANESKNLLPADIAKSGKKIGVPTPEVHLAKLRVLLAEDNPVNQKLAVRMLEKMGHEVTVAENGKLAFHRLREGETFDLVFMDVHMPEMDGYAATQAIRGWENARGAGEHVPIFAMTANAMAGDREKCLATGMDGYVSKPISREELVQAIQHVTELTMSSVSA